MTTLSVLRGVVGSKTGITRGKAPSALPWGLSMNTVSMDTDMECRVYGRGSAVVVGISVVVVSLGIVMLSTVVVVVSASTVVMLVVGFVRPSTTSADSVDDSPSCVVESPWLLLVSVDVSA